MLKTIEFIKEHQSNWRELLSQAPYFLTIKEEEHFALLKYDQIHSDFNEQIVKECRGLIIDKNTLEPVALSFYKFFNVQESLADKIDWNTAKVQEKIDGSKILVWFNKYKKQWQVSTSGVLDAHNATVNDFGTTFYDLFEKAFELQGVTLENVFSGLHEHFCYTFELVSPESRVVVPYNKTEVYWIGLRRTNDATHDKFKEVNPNDMGDSFLKTYCKRPKEYSLSNLQDCLRATEKMGFDEEGFVVVDANWNRVKIKSPAYVAAHHLKDNGNVNRKRVLEIVEANETDEFLGYFPEYKKYFDDIKQSLEVFNKRLEKGYEVLSYEARHHIIASERKYFAMIIMKDFRDISPFMFKLLDADCDLTKCYEMWNNLPSDKKLEYLDNYKNKEEN